MTTLFLLVAAGMALVRLGWDGRRWIAIAGWAIMVMALLGLVRQAGAWGLAAGGVVLTTAALILLLGEGWRTPARRWRPARPAPPVAAPPVWPELGRRLLVFALVVPGGGGAAFWLALGAQAAGRRHGALGEADATAMLLFAFPLGWCLLMVAQMTQASPRRMAVAPALVALLGTCLWLLA